ncbi:hypothetical protein WN944_028406 [Citrus x changshan-huyou]|uniref:Glycoside hydrolase family 19 catalytic domain-containing protein n=3 Tax=Citrus TaxID=2706 RepID=A0A067FLI1_CITSI|nr:hypothetical protein CISIN_1g032197mg [Citrus sinensis]GAY46100.1 hypothetical protein CUMW_094380 [Citrus unshiu]
MRLIGSLLIFSLVLSFVLGGSAQNCGSGVVCGERDTGHGTDGGELGKIISREMFEDLLPYRNDERCHARGFYTYDAFIEAAKAFPAFGNSGNETIMCFLKDEDAEKVFSKAKATSPFVLRVVINEVLIFNSIDASSKELFMVACP